MRVVVGVLIAVIALAAGWVSASGVAAASDHDCSDFSSQAAAQSYFDAMGYSASYDPERLDGDHDGVACESNPCPCAAPHSQAPATTTTAAPAQTQPTDPPPATSTAQPPPVTAPPATQTAPATSPPPTQTQTTASAADPRDTTDRPGCSRPKRVQNITFSTSRYPHIRRHYLAALRKGWPKTLVLNRAGASARRDRLLAGVETREGSDRDEYPPAIGRGRGRGLMRGSNPTGWRADVRLVASSENRSHGSVLGLKLRRFCSGTKFRYVFY